MKHFSIRVSVVALLLGGVVGLSSVAQAQDAAATYKAKCAMCHGADGKGGKMGTRDFGSADVKAETDAQLTDIITKGKGKMPAYDGKLKEAEIKDLVAYIRTLAK
ncbi:MAG TPA: cytochrome c [Candidatus Solibacter sp.]|nr:cytochrome c [Candidatus Solibacter sp.]